MNDADHRDGGYRHGDEQCDEWYFDAVSAPRPDELGRNFPFLLREREVRGHQVLVPAADLSTCEKKLPTHSDRNDIGDNVQEAYTSNSFAR